MLNFFDTLLTYVDAIWNFLIGIIDYTIVLTKTVLGSVEIPLMLSGYVPTFLWVSMSIVIALSVIKIILGRASL